MISYLSLLFIVTTMNDIHIPLVASAVTMLVVIGILVDVDNKEVVNIPV